MSTHYGERRNEPECSYWTELLGLCATVYIKPALINKLTNDNVIIRSLALTNLQNIITWICESAGFPVSLFSCSATLLLWLMDTVRDKLGNMEHVAAGEPDISPRSQWRPNQSQKRVTVGLAFISWTEMWQQVNKVYVRMWIFSHI